MLFSTCGADMTQAFLVVISAKDTKGSFASVDKWDQIDMRRLITLEERDVNEICQAMTRRESKRERENRRFCGRISI